MLGAGLAFRPNTLYYGDCLEVLAGWPAGCVDLVYLDPPFNSKANYNVLYGSRNGATAQVRAFSDTWHWDDAAARRMEDVERAVARRSHSVLMGLRTILGESGMLAYLSYMAERLEACRRVMTDRASFYLHCDPTASHYLKIVCDAVFGAETYRNDITWQRYGAHNDAKRFGRVHDCILMYTKGKAATWNGSFTPLREDYIAKTYRRSDHRGRYRTAPLHTGGLSGGGYRYVFRGYDCTWRYSRQRMEELERDGRIAQARHGAGVPERKVYLNDSKGVAVGDVWTDVAALTGNHRERLGYPTQKPLLLLERIIKASSNRDDVVLDPFCGCGTTVAAADSTQRRWVGVDISPFAVKLVRDRRLRPLGCDAEIMGVPTDMEGARMLLARSPFDFEAWVVTSIPGLVPNQRRTGDRGIDGRGAMMNAPDGMDSRLVLAQVKGGGYTASSMRDFQRVVERERAAAGVYVTLAREAGRGARRAAAELGTIEVGSRRYPRLQLWSVEELLAGRTPALPDMADPYTGKRIRQGELFE